MVDGQARGVLAFKVDMDVIERSWHGNDFEIIVTDPEGIIFMSGRPDWLFKSIGPSPLIRLLARLTPVAMRKHR